MKIVFMGTPQAAVPTLKGIIGAGHEVSAVWTQPDRPSGRGNKLAQPPVKTFALENKLEVFQPAKIKTAEALEIFESHQADAAVVVAYGRILPKTFLEAFPKGAVNVHFSLLPRYRGAAPVNWAIVNGESKTGITTIRMDEGLDTGDILLQRETAIGEDENAIELTQRLSYLGAEALCDTLKILDEIVPRKQDHAKAVLAPILKKEDGLIDWNLTANEIRNRVRGFQPFPRSYTECDGQKMTIWCARPEEFEVGGIRRVGEILRADGADLYIQCGGNTILSVAELQIEGKRRMMTRDFLNGVKLALGQILGG